MSARTLELVLPDLFDRGGGIARISQATTRACRAWAAARGARLRVHVLHDTEGTAARDLDVAPQDVAHRGYGGDKRALGRAVVRAALTPGHVGTVYGHVNLAALALASPHRPFAVVAHGTEVWEALSLPRTWALRLARRLMPISAFTGRALAQVHGVDPARVRVVPNCLDPSFEVPEAPAPRPDGASQAPYVVAVSRLSATDRYKGLDHTIKALADDALAGDPALVTAPLRFVVVGDGDAEERARLEGLAVDHGVADRVRFTGRISDEALERLLDGALALCLPSGGEGFGLVYVEAMARGRACVAADAGGAPEVVTDGETGWVVPFADVPRLAQALASLWRDPGHADVMGAAGQAQVRREFLYPRYEQRVAYVLSEAFS